MSSLFINQTMTNPIYSHVLDITVEDLHNKISQVQIIDVRREDEFVGELGHIAEAKLITLDFLEEKISALPKDKVIVFVCRSGVRSAHAAALALERGWKHVYNLKGGMIAWNESHLPVSR